MSVEIDLYVLDCLADDIEDLRQILHRLNHQTATNWQAANRGQFTREQVVPAVFRGIRKGSIEACIYSDTDQALIAIGENTLPHGNLDDVWFKLTPRGRIVLENWTPNVEPNDDV